jgi:hypothetical protein
MSEPPCPLNFRFLDFLPRRNSLRDIDFVKMSDLDDIVKERAKLMMNIIS